MNLRSYRDQIDWSGTLRQIFIRPPGEDPVIDGLRGIASLSIVLFHSFYGVLFLLKGYDPISSFITQLPPWLGFLTNTDKAVDLFFMVSAYLMGGVLFREMARSGRIAIRRFYLKRLFRIYPLFLLGIAIYAQGNLRQSFKNLIFNLLFIDNFRMKTIIPVGWSLSIEMQFYLILPFLIFGLWRLRESWRLPALQILFIMSFAALAATGLMTPITYETPMHLFHPEKIDPARYLDVIYYQSHTRFGPLILGLCWAWRRELEARLPIQQKKNEFMVALAGIALALVWLYFPPYRIDSWFYADFSPWLNLTCHTLHRGLFCVGVLMAVRFAQRCNASKMPAYAATSMTTSASVNQRIADWICRFLGARFWRPFSQVVFPIYLFHFPMVAIAGVLTFHTTDLTSVKSVSLMQLFNIFFIAATLSLALGVLLHVTIEQPMIRLGAKFLRGQNPNA